MCGQSILEWVINDVEEIMIVIMRVRVIVVVRVSAVLTLRRM